MKEGQNKGSHFIHPDDWNVRSISPLPTILEEEGKLFDEEFEKLVNKQAGRANYSRTKIYIQNVLLASHNRMMGKGYMSFCRHFCPCCGIMKG